MTATTATSDAADVHANRTRTVADLLERLGGIPPRRVLLHPMPGTATEGDVIRMDAHEDRLCELVEGTLVEKGMGLRESLLAIMLAEVLNAFVRARNLGLVSGEAGMIRILPGLVRIPDVAFISCLRVPGGRVPVEPIPAMAPDLAVEVLSESNTAKEMTRKRQEYFKAGGRLVWEVDPEVRTVSVYTTPDQRRVLTAHDTLDGGDVLPGFQLALAELFAELDRRGPE